MRQRDKTLPFISKPDRPLKYLKGSILRISSSNRNNQMLTTLHQRGKEERIYRLDSLVATGRHILLLKRTLIQNNILN